MKLRYHAEARISTGRNGWTAAKLVGQPTKAISVCVSILYQFVNPMVPEIPNTDRCAQPNSLLPFETPSLILRQMHPVLHGGETWRSEARIDCLDLSQSLATGKTLQKRGIGCCRSLEQTCRLVRTEV